MNSNIKTFTIFILIAMIPVVYIYSPQQFNSALMKSGSYLIQSKDQFDGSEYQLIRFGEYRFKNPVGAACFSKADQSFLVAESDGRIYKVWIAKDDVVKTKQVHTLSPASASGDDEFEILDIVCRSDQPNNSKRDVMVTVRTFGANRRSTLLYNGVLDKSNENFGNLFTKKPTIVIKNIASDPSNPGVIFGPNGSIILSFQTSLDGYLTSQDTDNFRGKIIALTPQNHTDDHEPCVILFTTSFGDTLTSDCGVIRIVASGNFKPLAMQLSSDSKILRFLDRQLNFGLEFNEARLDEAANFGWPYFAGNEVFRKTAVDKGKLTSPTNYYLLDEKGEMSSATFLPRGEPSGFHEGVAYVLVEEDGPSLYIVNQNTKQSVEVSIPNLGHRPVKINAVEEMIILTSLNSPLSILLPKGEENQFANAAIESKFLYSQYCEHCHGAQGKSPFIGIRELQDGKWKDRQNPASLTAIITDGITHKMPKFSNVLTDEQIRGLALYVQALL